MTLHTSTTTATHPLVLPHAAKLISVAQESSSRLAVRFRTSLVGVFSLQQDDFKGIEKWARSLWAEPFLLSKKLSDGSTCFSFSSTDGTSKALDSSPPTFQVFLEWSCASPPSTRFVPTSGSQNSQGSRLYNWTLSLPKSNWTVVTSKKNKKRRLGGPSPHHCRSTKERKADLRRADSSLVRSYHCLF
ncbi:hypothetical protein AMTR_s00111p00110390 [Amborella trichopoda]|uniref:Uncharacterized protein n=1 Tax=Amborella trichopoda TaxID=13333 RepID=W1NY05_AMBTC|nr:hypothetical protein AMTR_s00111p00110390 [Amborella trichopoda]